MMKAVGKKETKREDEGGSGEWREEKGEAEDEQLWREQRRRKEEKFGF